VEQGLGHGEDEGHRFARSGPARLGDGPVEVRHQPTGAHVQCLARGGQRDAPAVPLHQRDAQPVLQPRDRLADSWLRDAERCGGTAVVPLLGHRDEAAQLRNGQRLSHASILPS
jgi:hypothetical protein